VSGPGGAETATCSGFLIDGSSVINKLRFKNRYCAGGFGWPGLGGGVTEWGHFRRLKIQFSNSCGEIWPLLSRGATRFGFGPASAMAKTGGAAPVDRLPSGWRPLPHQICKTNPIWRPGTPAWEYWLGRRLRWGRRLAVGRSFLWRAGANLAGRRAVAGTVGRSDDGFRDEQSQFAGTEGRR
jgi:hypothetical protein